MSYKSLGAISIRCCLTNTQNPIVKIDQIDGLVQDCIISSVLAVELLQSSTKSSRWCHDHLHGLAQDCGNSSVLAMALLQFCAKPSILFPQWDFPYSLQDIFILKCAPGWRKNNNSFYAWSWIVLKLVPINIYITYLHIHLSQVSWSNYHTRQDYIIQIFIKNLLPSHILTNSNTNSSDSMIMYT